MIKELAPTISNLTLILQKTPKIQPFHAEVKTAISHIEHGDISSNPLWEIIHGNIGARASEGKLNTDEWLIKEVAGGKIVVHNQFMRIQNKFQELEHEDTENIFWDSEEALKSLVNYVSNARKYKIKHLETFDKALSMLNQDDQKRLEKIISSAFPHMVGEIAKEITLVAIPSQLDNQILWNEFDFSPDLLTRIPLYAKIHESGVVLASEVYRDDNPRGHDYFSYAARSVVTGQAKNLSQKLELTAQHEGSHGITDSLLIYLLEISDQNPIYEGFTGAFGEDGRENVFTSISIENLIINTPTNFDSQLKMEWSYIAAPKLFSAIFKIIAESSNDSNENVWSLIFAAQLRVALRMNNDRDILNLPESEKITKFFRSLIEDLNIETAEIEIAYNAINIKNGRVL